MPDFDAPSYLTDYSEEWGVSWGRAPSYEPESYWTMGPMALMILLILLAAMWEFCA